MLVADSDIEGVASHLQFLHPSRPHNFSGWLITCAFLPCIMQRTTHALEGREAAETPMRMATSGGRSPPRSLSGAIIKAGALLVIALSTGDRGSETTLALPPRLEMKGF